MIVGTVIMAAGLMLLNRHCLSFLQYVTEVKDDYERSTQQLVKTEIQDNAGTGEKTESDFKENAILV